MNRITPAVFITILTLVHVLLFFYSPSRGRWKQITERHILKGPTEHAEVVKGIWGKRRQVIQVCKNRRRQWNTHHAQRIFQKKRIGKKVKKKKKERNANKMAHVSISSYLIYVLYYVHVDIFQMWFAKWVRRCMRECRKNALVRYLFRATQTHGTCFYRLQNKQMKWVII